MAKKAQRIEPMSVDEFERLPLCIGAKDAARVFGFCQRYMQDHGSDFGGRMIGGRWCFAKPVLAEMLGIRD